MRFVERRVDLDRPGRDRDNRRSEHGRRGHGRRGHGRRGHGGGRTVGGGSGRSGGGLMPGRCHAHNDCDPLTEVCLAPGQAAGCGACMMPATTCAGDMECQAMGANMICDAAGCLCASTCQLGCTSNAQCDEASEICSAGRRLGTPCAAPSDCPLWLDCTTSACERRPCASYSGEATGADGECDGGFCVKRALFRAARHLLARAA